MLVVVEVLRDIGSKKNSLGAPFDLA